MTNHVVSGVLVPDATSGHPALELVNTHAGWGEPSPREYLVSYDALAVWSADVGHLRRVSCARCVPSPPGPPPRPRGCCTRRSRCGMRTTACCPPTSRRPRPRPGPGAAAPAYAASRLVVDAAGRIRPDGGRVAAVGLRLPLHRAVLAAVHLLAAGDGPRPGLRRARLRVGVPGPDPPQALVHDGDLRQPGQGPGVRGPQRTADRRPGAAPATP